MVSVKFAAVAGVATVLATVANAADMPELLPPPIEETAGWYLRGDIGFSNQGVSSVEYVPGPGEPAVTSQRTVASGFDSAGIFGLGFGYQFNSWLRTDVTGEYRANANYRGQNVVTSGGNTYPEQDFGSKSEWVVLANIYADLGTWWSVTPFVGVGIGAAYNRISNFQDIGVTTSANNFYGADNEWNFAWAVHAGVAYHVTPQLTLELAYRYIDLGDALTGVAGSWDGLGATGYQEFNHLTSHDLKFGIRWMLEPPQQPYTLPPLMRRG
jgi:opacity protein-like surface antigen